jgi:hypothetical protein
MFFIEVWAGEPDSSRCTGNCHWREAILIPEGMVRRIAHDYMKSQGK